MFYRESMCVCVQETHTHAHRLCLMGGGGVAKGGPFSFNLREDPHVGGIWLPWQRVEEKYYYLSGGKEAASYDPVAVIVCRV